MVSSYLNYYTRRDLLEILNDSTDAITIEFDDSVLLATANGFIMYNLGDLNIGLLKFPISKTTLELISTMLIYGCVLLMNKST